MRDHDSTLDIRWDRLVDLTRAGCTCVEAVGWSLESAQIGFVLGVDIELIDTTDPAPLLARANAFGRLPPHEQVAQVRRVRSTLVAILGRDEPALPAEVVTALIGLGYRQFGWAMSRERAAARVQQLVEALDDWDAPSGVDLPRAMLLLHEVRLEALGLSAGWRVSFPFVAVGGAFPARVFASPSSQLEHVIELLHRYREAFLDAELDAISALQWSRDAYSGGGAFVACRMAGHELPFEPLFAMWRFVDRDHEGSTGGRLHAWDIVEDKFRTPWEGYPRRSYRYEPRPMDVRRFEAALIDGPSGRAGPSDGWNIDQLGLEAVDLRQWAVQQRWVRAYAVIDEWNDRVLFGQASDGTYVLFTWSTGA